MMHRVAACCLLLVALACDEREDAGNAPPLGPLPGAEPAPPQKPRKEPYWLWPVGAGPQRDVYRDSRVCKEILLVDPELKEEHPLVQLREHHVCMKRLGWVEREKTPATRAR